MGKTITIEMIKGCLPESIGKHIPVEITELMRKYPINRSKILFSFAEPNIQYTADIRCKCGNVFQIEGPKTLILETISTDENQYKSYYLNIESGEISTEEPLNTWWTSCCRYDGEYFLVVRNENKDIIAFEVKISPSLCSLCAIEEAKSQFEHFKDANEEYYKETGKQLWD